MLMQFRQRLIMAQSDFTKMFQQALITVTTFKKSEENIERVDQTVGMKKCTESAILHKFLSLMGQDQQTRCYHRVCDPRLFADHSCIKSMPR